MVNKLIRNAITSLAALLLVSGSLRADDTDIYFQGGNTGVNPIVMFYIEYSPNLTSTVCTGVTAANLTTQCPVMADLQLYLSMPDASNPTANNDLADEVIDQFEMTRAALKRVLIALGDMKIGLITAHNNNANCAGPSQTGCSNGAQIYQRAVTLTRVSDIVANFNALNQAHRDAVLAGDANKAELFKKLDRLRSPQGNFSAPNQNKEVYFELYRYLTGKPVYNGHNGWTDFSTSATYNLGKWDTSPSTKGDYDCKSGSCTSESSGGTYSYNKGNGGFLGDFVELVVDNKATGEYINTYPLKWDELAESSGLYISPIDADCQKIFMINLVDGAGLQANDSDAAIKAAYASHGMNLNVSANDPGFVEMARWLFDTDLADGVISLNKESKQNVTSYFVAKQPQQVDAAALAGTGGANPAIALTTNPQSVVDALNKVFNQILSVSTTFVAASIPVNVFNRSEVIDNAFIALFQANASGQPQWVGNVKKLKLDIYEVQEPAGTDPTTGAIIYKTVSKLQLVDTNPDNIDTTPLTTAIDPPSAIATDGRIVTTALTYWSKPLGYDLFDNVSDQETAGRDGRAVNRGGVGQQIPGFLNTTLDGTTGHYERGDSVGTYNTSGLRKLLTNYNGSFIDLDYSNSSLFFYDLVNYSDSSWSGAVDYTQFDGNYSHDWNLTYATNVTFSGSLYPTWLVGYELQRVLWFIRGGDATDADHDNNNLEARRWMMGDPLHSRPIPINYGARSGYTSANPDIRIVVGSNDGFLRMIRNTNADGTESGKEEWAFMPRELLRKQKALMDNVATSPATHIYGLDGAPTAYVVDNDGTIRQPGDTGYDALKDAGDKVWVFFGLRRGGRAYYAVDVTNPDIPVYKWGINNTTTGFSELGYTFSQPVVRELDWGLGRRPVVIVAGGYDTNKDMAGLGTDDSMGNALFIIDASTGALVWKVAKTASPGTSLVNADLKDSIPSEVTAYDSSGDGLVDRIYVGDTGGSVWRVDMPSADRSSWTMRKILNLGRHYSNTVVNDRRFFHAPDVVPARDTAGLFDAVVIGSGDREHPLETGVDNFLYTFKDRPSAPPTTLTHADLTDITHLNDCLIAGTCSPTISSGWKLQLDLAGEKSLSSPLTLRGEIYFTSYIPKTSSCGPNEGSGRLYRIALSNGTAVYNYYSPNDTDEEVLGERDRFRELASGGIPAENVYVSYKDNDGKTFTGILAPDLNAGDDLGAQQWNTYWYEKQK